VYIAYLDESGVVEPSGTTHFVLVAFAIPASRWKDGDARLQTIKANHRLGAHEVHTAWLLRRYPEQDRIADLDKLSDAERRIAVNRERKIDLGKASLRGEKAVNELAKNYKKTAAYVHLTHAERVALVRDFADEVGRWTDARIFGDACRERGDPMFREGVRRLLFREVPYVALGYAKEDTPGSGIGQKLARHLADTALQIVRAGIADPTIFDPKNASRVDRPDFKRRYKPEDGLDQTSARAARVLSSRRQASHRLAVARAAVERVPTRGPVGDPLARSAAQLRLAARDRGGAHPAGAGLARWQMRGKRDRADQKAEWSQLVK
jgi:hypothetical protein